MQSKIALLAALSGFLAVSTARGDQGDVFWRRCPLVMGGTRRISFDHKLFTSCNKPIKGSKFGEVEWVWGELDLGKCFVNDNGEVKARYMYASPTFPWHSCSFFLGCFATCWLLVLMRQ